MSKIHSFLAIALLLATVAHCQFSKCPNANALQIAADTLTVSRQGDIGLVNGQDIQCYNYTLKNAFTCTPGVAIAVSDLQSAYSPSLFFSVKAIASDSNGIIPFVVRTHWGYTQWSKITFSFLAEGSSQLEAGYYQIDTGSLSSCSSTKSIAAFIPLVNQNAASTSALTFLNGFEISSLAVNSSYLTPF